MVEFARGQIDRTLERLSEDTAEQGNDFRRELSYLDMELLTEYLRGDSSYFSIPETITGHDQLDDWLRYVVMRRISERKQMGSFLARVNQMIGNPNA